MNGCTIGNRVLIHLSCYSRFREEYVCPQEMTQDGIASRLGISRAHVALELKRLKQRNQVEFRLAHVARVKSRRKVYSLTRFGEGAANDLKDKARRKRVRILDGNGGIECSGHEAAKVLSSAGVPESDAIIKILTTEAIPATNGGKKGGAADTSNLIGRGQELERLGRWLRAPGKAVCVLSGADGVGKSSLAVSLISTFEHASVYCRVRPSQSVRSLLRDVADVLAAKDKSRLDAFLSREDFDCKEAMLALAEEMAGGLLVLDDVNNSPEIENFAGLFLAMNDWPLKVLLVCRRKPAFCQRWSDTFQKPYEDMSLAGLDLEYARKLLTMYATDATEEGLKAAQAATQGRPLQLILLAELGWGFDDPHVPPMSELIRTRMSREEMDVLRLAAISRRPVEPTRIELTPAQATLLKRRSLFQGEDGRFFLNESLRGLVMEGVGMEEGRVLHAKAGKIADLANDRAAAAAHYAEAGLREQAVIALSKVDVGSARDDAAELLSTLKSVGDDERLDIIRGRVLENLGRLDDARASYERVASRAGNRSSLSLQLLAAVESRLSLPSEANRHYAMAVSAATECRDELSRARALRGLADVRSALGDCEEASRLYAEARELLEKAGEWREAVRCRASLGEMELTRGNNAGAVAELTAAVQGSGKHDVDSARMLADLGVACHRLGDLERARSLFLDAARVADNFGQARVAARSLANAADSYLSQGKTDEAADLCRKALRIGDRLDDKALLSSVHAMLGDLNRNLGLWKRAEEHIMASIEIVKTLNSPQVLASRYRDLAALYETKGDARKAKLWGTRAERLMEWQEVGELAPSEMSTPLPREADVSKTVQQLQDAG